MRLDPQQPLLPQQQLGSALDRLPGVLQLVAVRDVIVQKVVLLVVQNHRLVEGGS